MNRRLKSGNATVTILPAMPKSTRKPCPLIFVGEISFAHFRCFLVVMYICVILFVATTVVAVGILVLGYMGVLGTSTSALAPAVGSLGASSRVPQVL